MAPRDAIALCLTAWLFGAGCSDADDGPPCGEGREVAIGGDRFCAFAPVVIEGGFGCPPGEYRMEAGDEVICGPRNAGEGEVCDAIVCDGSGVYEIHGPGCENINPLACLLPWPSDRFQAADASTSTGTRIEIDDTAMPAFRDHTRVSAAGYSGFDGFSPSTPILTAVAGRIDTSELAGEDRIALTLTAESPTQLFDFETGERVAHFAEVDGWPRGDSQPTTLYLRPTRRLEPSRRYVVAIRTLHRPDAAHTPVSPSIPFAALRDGEPVTPSDLEDRRAHFDAIFAWLEARGIPRAELHEAWSFSTGSDARAIADFTALVNDGSVAGCTVDTPEDEPSSELALLVRGTISVASFLSEPDGGLVRDASGAPIAGSPVAVPFVAVVPDTVIAAATAGERARLLVLMHGLNDTPERTLRATGIRRFAAQRGFVVISLEHWGMTAAELPAAFEVARNMSLFPALAERFAHGAANVAQLFRALGPGGACDSALEARIGSVYNPANRYLLGLSTGGIHALTVSSVADDIDRVAAISAGLGYPTIARRSHAFTDLDAAFREQYPSATDRDLLVAMMQFGWDISDGGAFAGELGATEPVLIVHGVNDSCVPDVAAQVLARTLELPLGAPAPRVPFAMSPAIGAHASAYVEIDVGGRAPPLGSVPPGGDNGVHEGVRWRDEVHGWLDAFLRPGGTVP